MATQNIIILPAKWREHGKRKKKHQQQTNKPECHGTMTLGSLIIFIYRKKKKILI